LSGDGFDRRLIRPVWYSIGEGLPAGDGRFGQEIEQALAVKLGNGRRDRPGKSPGWK
jgi:hypothetical protein